MSYFWEGSREFNLTSFLIYKRPKISLAIRLSYFDFYAVENKCQSCLDGYLFDREKETCTAAKCGDNCSTCILTEGSNIPVCATCNETLLKSFILKLSTYVAYLYYGVREIPEIASMISFNASQTDCQLCPIA